MPLWFTHQNVTRITPLGKKILSLKKSLYMGLEWSNQGTNILYAPCRYFGAYLACLGVFAGFYTCKEGWPAYGDYAEDGGKADKTNFRERWISIFLTHRNTSISPAPWLSTHHGSVVIGIFHKHNICRAYLWRCLGGYMVLNAMPVLGRYIYNFID